MYENIGKSGELLPVLEQLWQVVRYTLGGGVGVITHIGESRATSDKTWGLAFDGRASRVPSLPSLTPRSSHTPNKQRRTRANRVCLSLDDNKLLGRDRSSDTYDSDYRLFRNLPTLSLTSYLFYSFFFSFSLSIAHALAPVRLSLAIRNEADTTVYLTVLRATTFCTLRPKLRAVPRECTTRMRVARRAMDKIDRALFTSRTGSLLLPPTTIYGLEKRRARSCLIVYVSVCVRARTHTKRGARNPFFFAPTRFAARTAMSLTNKGQGLSFFKYKFLFGENGEKQICAIRFSSSFYKLINNISVIVVNLFYSW